MTTIIICAGGPEEEIIPLAPFVNEGVFFIGADRGTLRLLEEGISPNAAVGDFDSVTPEEMARIEETGCLLEKRVPEKDETDTELALQLAYTWNPERIILTGVTGGRLDHMFSVLQLLIRQIDVPNAPQLIIANQQNELVMLKAGTYEIERNPRFSYVSFFSVMETVRGLTLSGFKYDVMLQDIHLGDTRFTSNEVVSSSCTVSIKSGVCLMVRSSDS